MMSKKTKDGGRVGRVVRNGIGIETTYEGEGKVVEVEKWVKTPKRPAREKGPVPNVEQRPQ